ncbi:MAG: DUF6470 family protein [Clostridiales bacterium]|nr:DUF6470 family protein [Clostridiales bacterium]
MKPLIEIRTIPISIQYKVTPAQVERKSSQAEVEITRDKKGLSIKSRPIKLNIDTFEARNSIIPTTKTSVEESANLGKQGALVATATYAQEGNMMVNIHLDQDTMPQLAANRFNAPLSYDFNIKFIPEQPMNMDWIPGEFQIEYEMDKLNFDWKTTQSEFQFTPADIEFTIAEHPRVVIEFVGDPIYVPPSANPNFEPAIDLLA